jgi:hypothetical protein
MDFVRGDATGLLIPAHGEALRAGGEACLNEAFHAFGSLPAGIRVSRITRLETCPGGSTGQKLFLTLEYEQADPTLHTDLFVKFSRDFSDKIRDDRGKHEMETEVRFAALSRLPGFPITVPIAYFADYHHESRTGLIISQRIAFGTGGIEPHHQKCLDHELAEPLDYYRVILKSLARIAAAHKSGRLSRDIDRQFAFDPEAAAARDPILFDESRLHLFVSRYADFALKCPQLLPANIAAAPFVAKLDREAALFLKHEKTVKRFLQSNPQFIALIHWNANIDNAWFRRDVSGALECGLMDWGHVNQMNVAFALWGCLCGAPLEIWDRHLDQLLRLFIAEFHGHGGPRLEMEELELHLQLYVAMMGVSYLIQSPSRILARLPEAATASGTRDPVFRKNETARNQLHIMTAMLNYWQTRDFGASLERLLKRVQ